MSAIRFSKLAVGLAAYACAIATTCGGIASETAAVVSMPLRGATLRIQLGLKDKQATSWDGQIDLTGGQVIRLMALQPNNAKVNGSTWRAATQIPARPSGKQRRGAPRRPILRAQLDAPPGARVSVTTSQGDFSFALSDIRFGQALLLLNGQARVERLPSSIQLTSELTDEDWPAATVGSDGTVWVAYSAYSSGPALDAGLIHGQREFEVLKPTTNGDQLKLTRFDGDSWSQPLNVTAPRLDVWRPAVAVDGKGKVWVIWSQQLKGNWDLYARRYDPGTGSWSKITRLTTEPGSDVFVAAATDPTTGDVHLCWQGWRDGNFHIFTAAIGPDPAVPQFRPSRLFHSSANQWCPSMAFDSQGQLYVAFDTYDRGNYDVKLIARAPNSRPKVIDIAMSPRYEARPCVAIDELDRVWVAYELGDVNWGKDTGLRWKGRSGSMLYVHRDIAIRRVATGQLEQVTASVPAQPVQAGYPRGTVPPFRRISLPRIQFDGAGRLWLLYRRHATTAGQGERWASFVTHSTADGWSPAFQLPDSVNVLDNRPALARHGSGRLLAIHSTDYRTGGTATAKQNDLYCAVLSAAGAAAAPPVGPPVREKLEAPLVHPNETEDVKRVRAYRATIDGKTYQLLRGEFHRHTALTAHQDMDGTLEEMWRYALDAADMDWIGNGDHENGNGVEYLWWLVQKQTDLFHHPPRFMPMFTYERSRSYPSGHRNPMFAQRGIRPLPYHPGGPEAIYGTPEQGAPDIKTLYAYLKHFGGICASHTSGTGMGTDWRDHDPEVEPVVEIFQGLRQNYEHESAPGAPTAQDAIGGYRPAGFVWNAWMKGHTLGIQVSSDHYSTHISYAIVYAQDTSREAILEAFKRRHCYGAMDNIILDVRCGQQMMGDVFTLKGKPTLDVTVIGTEPIARLSIIRGVGNQIPTYVYDGKPQRQQVKLRWTDMQPSWGERAYYYVRIEQVAPEEGFGALAWASPLWITAEQN